MDDLCNGKKFMLAAIVLNAILERNIEVFPSPQLEVRVLGCDSAFELSDSRGRAASMMDLADWFASLAPARCKIDQLEDVWAEHEEELLDRVDVLEREDGKKTAWIHLLLTEYEFWLAVDQYRKAAA